MDFRKKKKGLKKMKPRTLDEATFNYYSRIANLFNKDEFDNEEDKERCVHSLLKQFSKEGLKVSKEGMVSKLLEKLVTYANIKQFHGVLKNFSEDWETACSDRFASFVTQTLVRHSTKFFVDTLALQKDCKEFEEEELRQLQQEILKLILDGLIAYLCSKFAFFMQHFSASHVIRAVIEMLAGTSIDDTIICGNKNFQQQEKTPSHSTVSMRLEIKSMFDEMFMRICNIITSLPKLEDHVCNHLSNPVLQTLILCLKTLPEAKATPIFKATIENTNIFRKEAEDGLPSLCSHEVASRFAEQAFKSMPDVMLDEIYSQLFKGHLSKMASSPTANFVLQKLISSSRNKEQFEQMYNEVYPHFESILAVNHVEVLVKISEACIKHSCKQMKFIKHISKAFHCQEPESRRCKIAQLLLSLTTYDIFYKLPNQEDHESSGKKEEESKSDMDVEDEEDEDDDDDDDEVTEENDEDALCLPKIQSINIYGSIIVQNLLNFSNTSSIVLSLFELSTEEWKLLCKDPCGCRVVEVFIRSKTVSEKSKDSLYVKLAGNYLDIACDKWGSRVFDTLWSNAKQKEKNLIIDELNRDPMKLKSDKFGFFIHQKCLNVSQKRRNDGQDKTQNKKMRSTKKDF